MNKIPEDLYNIIFSFLSLKDKIITTEVCKTMNVFIKPIVLQTYKLENKLIKLNCIELKMKYELICNNVYKDFKFYKYSKIHKYFRVLENYERCIANCRAERLGYVYYLLKPLINNMCLYNKRYIPYCMDCFKTWQIK